MSMSDDKYLFNVIKERSECNDEFVEKMIDTLMGGRVAFECIYGYTTEDGCVGIVRARNITEAQRRVYDRIGSNTKQIVNLAEFDNVDGVIVFNKPELNYD